MARPAADSLEARVDALVFEARGKRRRDEAHRALVADTLESLHEHGIASRELDGNEIRKAGPDLRELAKVIAKIREVPAHMAKVRRTLGTDLASYDDDDDAPYDEQVQSALATLASFGACITRVLAKSSRPGRTTKGAERYTLVRLVEIAIRHTKALSFDAPVFARHALALIGVKLDADKVRRLINVERRFRRATEREHGFPVGSMGLVERDDDDDDALTDED